MAPLSERISERGALKLALFGEPLSHSRSPRLQRAHADWLGRPLEYHLLPSSSEGFTEALERARALGVTGANVTAPHKALACTLCERLSPSAAQLGVVNTLSWGPSGSLDGHNTDLVGLELSLKTLLDDRGLSASEVTLRLIGAGGSARPAAWAALNLGVERLELVSRAPSGSRALKEWLELAHPSAGRPTLDIKALTSSSPALHQSSPELCALATPPLSARDLEALCGARAQQSAPLSLFDLNYAARAQVSREWAERSGAQHLDGALMLAEQGRRSFERWTGALPPLECSLSALQR